MIKYTLRDDALGQDVAFTGRELGRATTERGPATLRWTEVAIYETTAGQYVVHKIGCSRVVHAHDSTCSASAQPILRTELYDDAIPCPRCTPDINRDPQPLDLGLQFDNDTDFLEEVDRSNVYVSSTPSGAVESLYTSDRTGLQYMTVTARAALRNAATKDGKLDQASRVRKIA